MVLHDVHHLACQHPRLPCKCAARLQQYLQVRIAAAQALEQTYQVLHIIVFARHQMPAAEVEPLYLPKPLAELRLNMLQRPFEGVGVVLAMAVAMKTLQAFGQSPAMRFAVGFQLLRQHPKPRARRRGVVEQSLYLRILGIDTNAVGHTTLLALGSMFLAPSEPLPLAQAVEGDMARIAQELAEVLLRVGGAVGVRGRTKLLISQPRLIYARCRGMPDILAEDREGLPKRKRLECQDYLHTRLIRHALYQREVTAQKPLFHYVARIGKHD